MAHLPVCFYRWVYQRYVAACGARKSRFQTYLWGKLKARIGKWANPVIEMEVDGVALRMPFSHKLPRYRAMYRDYDTALPRLAAFLRGQAGRLAMIDIGANIGDTVRRVAARVPDGRFLGVEADPLYFALLQENTRSLSSMVAEQKLCAARLDQEGLAIERRGGTGRVTPGKSGTVSVSTLDHICDQRAFRGVTLLKIDTDGYDYACLRGAEKVIAENHPALFIEFTPDGLRAAGASPQGLLQYLLQLGYPRGWFYDHLGLPLGEFSLEDETLMGDLIAYGYAKPLYYDILAFHQDQQAAFREFLARERAYFQAPLYESGSLETGAMQRTEDGMRRR